MNKYLLITILPIIFAAGWFFAKRDAEKKYAQSANTSEAPSSALPASSHDLTNPSREKKSTPSTEELRTAVIIEEISTALKAEKEVRTLSLPRALEKTTDVELTPRLYAVFQDILREGNTEEANYLLSLMEQREDHPSRKLMLEAFAHQDEMIRERAHFALEAVAGKIFKDITEAQEWYATWQPDPENVKLFHGQQDDVPADLRTAHPAQKPPSELPANKTLHKEK